MPAKAGSFFPGQRRRRRARQQRHQEVLRRGEGEQEPLLGQDEDHGAEVGADGGREEVALFGAMLNCNLVPLTNLPSMRLRFLTPSDVSEIKGLCQEWFPVSYPDAWFASITSEPERFFSLAAVLEQRIIGLLVAEVRQVRTLPKEDSEIVSWAMGGAAKAAYLLSLGVAKELRKHGIASFLLDTLLRHLSTEEQRDVKAVYLHVLTTNFQAIGFYEHRGFVCHSFLPFYYNIGGKRRDGFTYVRYLNDGRPPWPLLDYCSFSLSLLLLSPLGALHRVCVKLYRKLPRVLRQMASSSAAMVVRC